MDEVLTKQFEFIKFPKVIKHKAVRNFKDYGWNSTIKKPKKPIKKRIVVGQGAKKKKSMRKRLPSVKSLKRKADSFFSKFIIARDKKCVLCSATTELTNGHLIKRGKMSTRYDEINCHALCSGCNYKDNFEPQHYSEWFIKKYGVEEYFELVDTSKEIKQFKRQDFLDIIKKYGKI